MLRLTPAEEQVMLKLWELNDASIKDIIELYEGKKPAYNTTSTIVRILEKKKFIKHKKIGRGFTYQAKISKDDYRDYLKNWLVVNYFNGNYNVMDQEINSEPTLDDILGN